MKRAATEKAEKVCVMRLKRKKIPVRQWKKNLYQHQQFSDNYTDASFLSELKTNAYLYRYSFLEAALPLCSITVEISCTMIFLVAFTLLKQGFIRCEHLAWCSTLSIVVLMVLTVITGITKTLKRSNVSVPNMIKCGVVLLSCGYVFSPVLKTLTETISTDTIYAMVGIMLFIHIVSQDYFPSSEVISIYRKLSSSKILIKAITTATINVPLIKNLSVFRKLMKHQIFVPVIVFACYYFTTRLEECRPYSCLSVSSALFSAVCLASRLPTIHETFGFTSFAFQIFLFTPCCRAVIQDQAKTYFIFTGILSVIVSRLLLLLATSYCVFFILISVFINIFCPSLFVKYQIYKENIHGPWDEAVIKVEDEIAE